MPIKVPNNLPAIKTLTDENVFVMTDTRAMTQDIRPLQILILNLMPTKIDTETQLTRLLGNTPLQVELELLQTSTHKAQNTSQEHMIAFYKTFDQIKEKYYDGMIITGAPVELLDFEEVEYWDELCEIMEWSKRHVHSTFHICWGAQAGLYYHYGIKKRILKKKLSGVYLHTLDYKTGMLFRGFDDEFYVPHSRNTTVDRADVEAVPELKVIASSREAGIFAVKSENDRQIFIMGHSEYDYDTLQKEYNRDKAAGINPEVPCNYFPDDDDTQEPVVRWRSCANLLYSNWLNYFVYQSTSYDINKINEEVFEPICSGDIELKTLKFGGTSLAGADQFRQAAAIIKAEKERRYVVVSAPGKRFEKDDKITDLLLELPKADAAERETLLQKIRDRFDEIESGLGVSIGLDNEIEYIRRAAIQGGKDDFIASRGEYLCAKIMAEFIGYDFVDAARGIYFDAKGSFDAEKTKTEMSALLKKHQHAVVPGFYGSMPDGSIKTFTRGGSDITGSIVAAASGSDLYENWTDVSGLLMADPRIVSDPITVPVITYKELRELSYMGAAVMHEDTVFPVARLEIPINIRNTAKPEEMGTLIVKNADYYQTKLQISGISGKTGFASITVEKTRMNEEPQIRSDVLDIFSSRGITIKNILSGIDSLNIIVPGSEIDGISDSIVSEINSAVKPDSVSVSDGIAIIAIVGRELGTSPAIAVKVLGALANRRINIKLIDHGAEKINMIIGVDEKDYVNAVQAIYSGFAAI